VSVDGASAGYKKFADKVKALAQVRDRNFAGCGAQIRVLLFATHHDALIEQLQLLHLYFTLLFPSVYLHLLHIMIHCSKLPAFNAKAQ